MAWVRHPLLQFLAVVSVLREHPAAVEVSEAGSARRRKETFRDLDTIATLSQSASRLLDQSDVVARHYVLEVSSRGVDRPLTSEKHFRRARGRKAELVLVDGSQLTGRLGDIDVNAQMGRSGPAPFGVDDVDWTILAQLEKDALARAAAPRAKATRRTAKSVARQWATTRTATPRRPVPRRAPSTPTR